MFDNIRFQDNIMSRQNSFFNALSDPTRRDILKMLRARDMTPGEIITKFSMTKPSLSHHLEILKNAGLVIAERKGQHIVYSLNISVLDEVVSVFMDIFGKPKQRR
jgi:ArsR family transcriptional regulator, arsenate/arsenite/antimonite-responsive transcriptional repressor